MGVWVYGPRKKSEEIREKYRKGDEEKKEGINGGHQNENSEILKSAEEQERA